MTAEEILSITNPGDLFSDPSSIIQERKALLKVWHPDKNKNPEATPVFQHIEELCNKADEQIRNGEWESKTTILIKSDKGITYKIGGFRYVKDTVMGRVIIGDSRLVYIIKNDFRKYVPSFKFKYASVRV